MDKETTPPNQPGGLATQPSHQQVIVMWTLWFSFAMALVFYRFTLVRGNGSNHSFTAPDTVIAWMLYLIPIAVVLSLRWLLIPRLRNPSTTMSPFIVCFAFAEALAFFGIFLFKNQLNLFYLTAWLLVLQLMPLWKQKTAPPAA
jgi:hypothetical protein